MNLSHFWRKTLKSLGITITSTLVILVLNINFASAIPSFQSLWDNYPLGESK
jgi:hypothetical protein